MTRLIEEIIIRKGHLRSLISSRGIVMSLGAIMSYMSVNSVNRSQRCISRLCSTECSPRNQRRGRGGGSTNARTSGTGGALCPSKSPSRKGRCSLATRSSSSCAAAWRPSQECGSCNQWRRTPLPFHAPRTETATHLSPSLTDSPCSCRSPTTARSVGSAPARTASHARRATQACPPRLADLLLRLC